MNSREFKELRLRQGLTQQKFGERLGFSVQWARMRVSEIERGARPVSPRTEQLCRMMKGRKS